MASIYDYKGKEVSEENLVDLSAERLIKRQPAKYRPDIEDIEWGDFEYVIPETRGERATRKIVEAFDSSEPVKESTEDVHSPCIRLATRLKMYGLGLVATGLLVAISDGETQGETNVKCTGWHFEGPLKAGQGYSSLIEDVNIGDGLTQNNITDQMADRNGTNNPAAGGVFETPSSCKVAN